MPVGNPRQGDLYREAAADFATALGRLARAYESDAEKCRDLLQEIHLALWRSFSSFDGRCSLRTWVYRVAHNTAASHCIREQRRTAVFLTLEEIEASPWEPKSVPSVEKQLNWERLLGLIHKLKPPDRQLVLLYLDGLDGASIAEIAGLTPANAAKRLQRIKNILADRFHGRGHHNE